VQTIERKLSAAKARLDEARALAASSQTEIRELIAARRLSGLVPPDPELARMVEDCIEATDMVSDIFECARSRAEIEDRRRRA
jgi:type II secretory pathway component PulM